MKDQYCIYSSINPDHSISITHEEYLELKEAKLKLQQFLYIEEKLNFLIENYVELEKELIDISISNLVTPLMSRDWTNYVDEIHKINRRIINLLTTSRMYLDHTAHDLKLVCNNKPDVLDMYKRLMNSEYDSVLGYRVMEALRNFVQHRGLPVHVISHKTSRTDDNRIKHLIIPIIRINDLESDSKFKKKVLEELKEEGDKLDIRLYIRQYIQSFYKFQKFIREILAEEVQNNDNLVNNAYLKCEEEFGQKSSAVAISKVVHEKYHQEVIHIMRDIITRRKWLEDKNSIDKDLTKNFVTGEL